MEEKNKIIGVTAGAFDLCHAGHMLMFQEAKKKCDFLIVLLQEDPSITDASYRGKKKHTPIQSLEERKIILKGVSYIDSLIIYKTEEDLYKKLVSLSKKHKDSLRRFIGADWKGKNFTGKDLPIKTVFNSRNHSYSTTELIERIKKMKN
jgi:glycerol-3-phosphate cytidylyltransferase